jgi:TPR repeat protein
LKFSPEYLEEQFALACDLEDSKKHVESFKIFLKLAENGHIGSMNNVGIAYDSGLGVEWNLSKALYWLKRAIKNGETFACINLGITYRNHGYLREAKYWFEKGLAEGYNENALELAQIYFVSDKEFPTVERFLQIALADKSLIEMDRKRAFALRRQLKKLRNDLGPAIERDS